MSPQLAECIAALHEDHWKADQQEADAIREWAEINYVPSDGIWKKDAVSRHVRYVGEPVAAVFATDPYMAEDAADLDAWPLRLEHHPDRFVVIALLSCPPLPENFSIVFK